MSLLLLVLICLSSPAARAQETFQISSCDSGDEWNGGEVVDDPIQEGSGSIRWAIADANQLERVGALDLSGYNMLRFWLHTNHPHALGGNVLIYLGSENGSTDGADYYHLQLPIDWEGWQELTIPIDELGPSREPRGLDQIDNFRLIASGWDNTPDETLVLHIDDLRALNLVIEGPVVTVEELLGALDLSRPGLEAVFSAHDAGDITAATAALCDYYRARTEPPWEFDPHAIDTSISYDHDRAEDTVAGTFTYVGHTYSFPDEAIDWSFNPTEHDSGVAYSAEWLWQIARMQYWPNLGRAYWATGDDRYAQTFIDQLESFVVTRAVPDWMSNGRNSSWRTIEAGIRMSHTWHDGWNYFLHSPTFTDQRLVLMLQSFYEHGQYLRAYQTSGNWIFHELGGLFTLGSVFPEFTEAAEWRTFAAEGMYDEMEAQFLSDGGQWELTPGYHRVSLNYLVDVVQVASLTGTEADVPEAYSEGLQEAFHWLIKLSTPIGGVPHLNDSWDVDVARQAADGLELFPDDELISWAASGRAEGSTPEWTSVQLWASGYTVIRSGWETDAHYALLDVGPLGYGHYHQDKLNLVLLPYGRRLLFDNGGGNYERSAFRDYGVDTHSHNTVLVDGLAQRRLSRSEREDDDPMGAGDPETPSPVFRHEVDFDYASGFYQDGYGEVDDMRAVHRREVLYVKPSLFFVVDQLTPNDSEVHSYQARWHLLTTSWDDEDALHATVTADSDQPNLAIIPLEIDGLSVASASGVTEPELLGWDLGHSGGRGPALTVLHDRSGAGVQRFVTLLLPLELGEPLPISTVHELTEGTYEIELDDGSSVTLMLGEESAGGMTVTIDDGSGGLRVIETDPSAWECVDEDGDGFGTPPEACPMGASDCNDNDDTVFPGASENCNGFDDDCDGEVDEGEICGPCTDGDIRPCYSGPADTIGVGLCIEGQQQCSNDRWAQCEGDVLPSPEICDDGDDNDCDGFIDSEDSDECDETENDGGISESEESSGCSCRQSGGIPAGTPSIALLITLLLMMIRDPDLN